jgi:hypothetical protein
MSSFGPAAVLGLCVGFMWGTGCSLAIMYSIYLGGCRKAVEDTLAPTKSKRLRETLKRIALRRAQEEASSAPK